MIEIGTSIILFLVAAAFVVVTVVLLYHWHRYGRKSWAIPTAEVVYLVVGVMLISIAISAYMQIV